MAAAQGTEVVSFVQTEMRGAAMKLHSRDQSREGEQKAQTPVTQWEPQRKDYLQFLVDSRHVYRTFEDIVSSVEIFAPFRNSGLERAEALDKDIAWFSEQGETIPEVGSPGAAYADKVRSMADAGEWEAFVCHFYNYYFAHTAGGTMIGKMMSDKLLNGHVLHFYEWPAGDVKQELLPALRGKIDEMAAGWTREQKDACLNETAESFRGGGSLLTHIRGPGGGARPGGRPMQ